MKLFPPLRRFVLVLLGGALVLFGGLVFVQAGMIYFPRPYTPKDLAEMGRDGLRPVVFRTKQGDQVAYYKGPAAGVPEKIWLVFCGNGARSADYREIADREDSGYLFVDYPGYGSCSGKPSPKRTDAQVVAAVAALTGQLGADATVVKARLCAFGHSLGAAVALRSAVIFGIGEVVIVSPFTSMKDMASAMVGKLLSNALLHRYDNVAALTELVAAQPDARVTLFHGRADEVVPFAMGESLAGRFPENVTFRPVDGSGHNDIVGRELAAITAEMVGR